MADRYDVIIAGARCSGASLGIHLARAGVKVLIVDAAKLPSDHVLSTHYLHPSGLDELDNLGVGDVVRTAAPATRQFAIAADASRVLVTYPDGRAGRSVRRFKLDRWLQEAAIAAGVEIRDRCRVVELLRSQDRVSGVVVETPGRREAISAPLVVGADGQHSSVAELAGVEEYLGFDMTRGGYWFYWPAPPAWRNRDYQMLLAWTGDGLRYAFQTDDDLLLLVAAPPLAEARSWGRDYRSKYMQYLLASEHTADLVEGNQPIEPGAGFLKGRFFYRRAVGAGFALVGDAGNFKDVVTGHGMTDALLGARWLAEAILDGRPEAFEVYWRRRDAQTLPLYFDARRRGAVGANTPLLRLVIERAGRHRRLADRFGLVSERRISPTAAFSRSRILAWVLAAALRGRPSLIASFLKTGREFAGEGAEIRERRLLLRRAEAALAGTAPQLPPSSPPTRKRLPAGT